ncbi:MAG: sugar ABC transporter permease [Actinomycetota bacterium]|nr:sugar ABC transporter permease [Actinomycetota bacterium]
MNELEEKEEKLEALLSNGEFDEDSAEVLNKEIDSIKNEIVGRVREESDITAYTLLLKREETVNSILEESGEQFSPKYSSINDFIFKSAGVSRSYFLIFMGISIIVLILLGIFFKWISRITTPLNLHGLKNWKNKHFERFDSPLLIILIYITVLIACIIAFYPLLSVFSISLRPANNLFSTTLEIIPKDWTFDNYTYAIVGTRLPIWLKNSLIVSISVAVIGVVFSASAGYAFSRFRFYGRRSGMIVLLVTQMFPAPMLLLPTYVILSKLGLKDELIGLAIPYAALVVPFSVWLLKGYFDTIPKDIEESAYMDGCSSLSAFIRIILPLSKPALAIVTLYAWMTAWTEYVIARVIVSHADKQTLPIGLVNLQGEFNTLWGVYSAAALMTSIPVIILFVALSRYLVGGLVLGSVKE